MTRIQHHALAEGKWQTLTLVEQLANIGSEVSRCISWKINGYGNPQSSFYRALELIDLTVADPKNGMRLREICRVREALNDWWLGGIAYHTTDEQWERYFYQFGILSRLKN